MHYKVSIMNLQTRKLTLIEYLIQLNDEILLKKIETFIAKNSKDGPVPYPILSKEELVERANESNDDYKAGRFLSQDELEKDSENW